MCPITTYVSHVSFTLVGLYDLQWEGQICFAQMCFAHNSHSTYCDAFMSPNVLSSQNVNDTCGECEAWCAAFMSPNVFSSQNVYDKCGECEAWCALQSALTFTYVLFCMCTGIKLVPNVLVNEIKILCWLSILFLVGR